MSNIYIFLSRDPDYAPRFVLRPQELQIKKGAKNMNRYNECDILINECNKNDHRPSQITANLLYRNTHKKGYFSRDPYVGRH